jgi:3-hydroxyisobutyrate dehydrogenase-like beta-hydroxyacid dehydrogenase
MNMQEIAAHVFIETAYPGVTLAALNTPHGLILVDAPLRGEDTRSWRATLLNMGGGVERLLVNLDAHFDRTLGARAMDCTVVAHEKFRRSFATGR